MEASKYPRWYYIGTCTPERIVIKRVEVAAWRVRPATRRRKTELMCVDPKGRVYCKENDKACFPTKCGALRHLDDELSLYIRLAQEDLDDHNDSSDSYAIYKREEQAYWQAIRERIKVMMDEEVAAMSMQKGTFYHKQRMPDGTYKVVIEERV